MSQRKAPRPRPSDSGSHSRSSVVAEAQEAEAGVEVRFAGRKREEVEPEVGEDVAGSWIVYPDNPWAVLVINPHQYPARLEIRFAGAAEILAGVRQGILSAAEQNHQILRPILSHLVGHRSYPGAAGTERRGSDAGRAETVVGVVRQESQFVKDTGTPAGPIET